VVAGHYKYTAQSSHRYKTRTVTITGCAQPMHMDTSHTRGCALAAMKTGLDAGCGLSTSASMVTPRGHELAVVAFVSAAF